MINTRVNSATGFAPATMKFGFENALESDLFEKNTGSNCPQEFVRRISEVQANLIARYNELAESEGDPEEQPTTVFTPGTYVLVDLVQRSKRQVAGGKRSGPFRVLAQRGAAVDLYDPTSKLPKQVHVSRCRLYNQRKGEDPMVEAVKYTDFYLIDRITAHKFVPSKSRRAEHLHLTVYWKGYDEPSVETGQNKSVLKTEQFRKYASDKPELVRFIL